MNIDIIIDSLSDADISQLRDLFLESGPYVSTRGLSDYWLYARLFHNTCITAKVDGVLVGAILGFKNQIKCSDIYIQDVVISERCRGKGIGSSLLKEILKRAKELGVKSVWLTSETDNLPAMKLWKKFGFTNQKSDYQENGFWVTKNLKGPGKDRVIFSLDI